MVNAVPCERDIDEAYLLSEPLTVNVDLGTKSAFTMISEYRTICQIIMKTSFVIPVSSFFMLLSPVFQLLFFFLLDFI